jgi:aminoglycoside phosphotransferase (APT) family kinase protein
VDEQQIIDWVGAVTGGSVIRVERQARWRPCWWVDVERDGDRIPLYLRGNRVGFGTANDVFREARAGEAMAAGGIPAPRVWGQSTELDAVLWDALPGVDNANVPEPERPAARRAFAEVLARLHRADPELFVHTDRKRPVGDRAVATADHDFWVKVWQTTQDRPEPLIAFVERWLTETMPSAFEQVSPLQGDAGQFMWDGERITGLVDLEMVHLGDPHHDLAFVRMRDFSEPVGGVADTYRWWAEAGGFDLDLQRVRWFGVMAAIETPEALSLATTMPLPPGDLAQYLTWYVQQQRCAIEILAEHDGIELDPPDVPAERATLSDDAIRLTNAWRAATGWLDQHGRELVGEPFADADAERQRRGAASLVEWQHRCAVFGPSLDAATRTDVAAIIGGHEAGDAVVDRLATLNAVGLPRPDVVRTLHRWIVRTEWLLEPVLGDAAGNVLSPITDVAETRSA